MRRSLLSCRLYAGILYLILFASACTRLNGPESFEGYWEGSWSGIPFDAAITDIQQVLFLRIDDSGTMDGSARIYDAADHPLAGFSLDLRLRGLVLGDGSVRLEGTWHASEGISSEEGICRMSGRIDSDRGGRLHWDGSFPFFPEADATLYIHRLDEFVP